MSYPGALFQETIFALAEFEEVSYSPARAPLLRRWHAHSRGRQPAAPFAVLLVKRPDGLTYLTPKAKGNP